MTFLEAVEHLRTGGRIGVQDEHNREQVELIIGSNGELRWKREECDDPERISIDDVMCSDYYTLPTPHPHRKDGDE